MFELVIIIFLVKVNLFWMWLFGLLMYLGFNWICIDWMFCFWMFIESKKLIMLLILLLVILLSLFIVFFCVLIINVIW